MRLAEKLIHLRQVEGQVRGLQRPLTKAEMVRAMRDELGDELSQAYLSQLEAGARVHLSASTRDLLARFFKVHPGYLVDDPPGYQEEIGSAELFRPSGLREWLSSRAEEQRGDPLVYRLFLRLSRQEDPRRYLATLDDLLDVPIENVEEVVRALTGASDRNGHGASGAGSEARSGLG